MKRTLIFAAFLAAARLGLAQDEKTLTLTQAEEIALRQHPRIGSASLTGQAANAQVTQTKAAYYPTVTGNLTSVGAEQAAAVAAGALTTSALSSRAASGIAVNQLITDFGRTGQLVESSKLRAAAQGQQVSTARAQVLLEVRQAYYQTLSADSVLKVAQATVEIRRLTLRQVAALAKSALKSTLDVSFAEVNLSEAELALYQAENNAQANRARLSAALGYQRTEAFGVADEPLPDELEPDPETLVEKARNSRPDLAALALTRDSSQRFAEAEKRLRYPSVSLLGVGGGVPAREQQLRGSYGAAGINVSIPLLNGNLFSARRAEAEFRAAAVGKDVQDLELQVSREVRVAWLEARTAFRQLDVAARLVEQANQALRLAQARYELGLSSIVELNQAQLRQTSAQITAASAKYDYLSRRAVLDYATGALR